MTIMTKIVIVLALLLLVLILSNILLRTIRDKKDLESLVNQQRTELDYLQKRLQLSTTELSKLNSELASIEEATAERLKQLDSIKDADDYLNAAIPESIKQLINGRAK